MTVNRRRSSRIAVVLATIAALAFVPTIVSAQPAGGVAVGGIANAAPAASPARASGIPPTLSWATPAAITFPTPLSGAQLDATATDPGTGNPVPGTFAYNPPAGTVLNCGLGQTLSATFTPTDTVDYDSGGVVTTTIDVLGCSAVAPTLTWQQPANICQGTPLSGTQLDAGATDPVTHNPVTGTFTYAPPGRHGLAPGCGADTDRDLQHHRPELPERWGRHHNNQCSGLPPALYLRRLESHLRGHQDAVRRSMLGRRQCRRDR